MEPSDDLEARLAEWNASARSRIASLRERAEARRLALEFVHGLGALARDLWHEVGKDALGAAARALVADALEKLKLEKR